MYSHIFPPSLLLVPSLTSFVSSPFLYWYQSSLPDHSSHAFVHNLLDDNFLWIKTFPSWIFRPLMVFINLWTFILEQVFYRTHNCLPTWSINLFTINLHSSCLRLILSWFVPTHFQNGYSIHINYKDVDSNTCLFYVLLYYNEKT